MQKRTLSLPEIKLVGISSRTNLANEINPAAAKIGATIQQYFQETFPAQISHRKKPGVTFCVFTDYQSDYTGDYTFFIGEEVTSFEDLPKDAKTLAIQPQTYAVFTTPSGVMPTVVIEGWKNIWKMTPQELGGRRAYHADFEVYDQRASDPKNTVLDIYIGVQK
jgi:predicted transcriptional regulator YdeE